MKIKVILILSICINVALGGFYLVKKPAASSTEATQSAGAGTNSVPRVMEKSAVTQVVTNDVAHKFDWRLVESEDYKKYIANLRSIGCPEETIRDIIIADVNKMFESRAKASKPKEKFKFWQTGMQSFAGIMDEEKIKQQQALNQEKRALLKELLGVEPEEKPDIMAMFGGGNPFEAMLDFLSPGKQTQVMELEQKYAAKMMKTFQNGQPDAEDMKEMVKVQKEKDAELAKIMTPEEKQDYDLRMSQTAMMMRMQLGSFDPGEQEFRDIFNAKKKFDDEFSPYGMLSNDPADQEKRTAAQKELDSQLKNILGDSRYADYQRAQDYNYQNISKLVERQGLPKEDAVKVYEMKKAADDQTQKLTSDATLSDDARKTAQDQIKAETEKAMRGILGDKGYESYKKQAGNFGVTTFLSP
jgi:hypothetical protein